jgi:hypothetical protein
MYALFQHNHLLNITTFIASLANRENLLKYVYEAVDKTMMYAIYKHVSNVFLFDSKISGMKWEVDSRSAGSEVAVLERFYQPMQYAYKIDDGEWYFASH